MTTGTVLVAGATGFVGQLLVPHLQARGYTPRGTSRDPERARIRYPDQTFVALDVEDSESIVNALRGCDAAVFLVHSMGDGGDYEQTERESARRFIAACEAEGVRRVVYLGGVQPQGTPSRHLRSRRATGEALRGTSVSTIELRAAMIIGARSESWQMVRDLAVRLPVMVLPRWLRHTSEPIAIDDVCAAIARAIELPMEESAVYSLPGPEVLSGVEILKRVAGLEGMRALAINVPLVTPKLSSYWIQLVTRANHRVASELVEGLTSDLIAQSESFWNHMPDHTLTEFDVAAKDALAVQRGALPFLTRLAERTIRTFSLSPKAKP